MTCLGCKEVLHEVHPMANEVWQWNGPGGSDDPGEVARGRQEEHVPGVGGDQPAFQQHRVVAVVLLVQDHSAKQRYMDNV